MRRTRALAGYQPDLPAFGPGPLVRGDQGVQPGAAAEPGARHVDHEGRARAGRGVEQRRPAGGGDVDLLRRDHDGHAAGDADGEPGLSHRHRRHLRAGRDGLWRPGADHVQAGPAGGGAAGRAGQRAEPAAPGR
jgi:hypothetical protein